LPSTLSKIWYNLFSIHHVVAICFLNSMIPMFSFFPQVHVIYVYHSKLPTLILHMLLTSYQSLTRFHYVLYYLFQF
jgi:hypothetical protein